MLQQFHSILHTPKQPPSRVLNRTQDLILTTFQEILPGSFDISELHRIFEEQQVAQNKMIVERSRQKRANNLSNQNYRQDSKTQKMQNDKINNEPELQSQITVNLKLIEYFVKIVKQNFVSLENYRSLQDQTQKAEATIRSHIKLQQEMHMYISEMEKKLINAETIIHNMASTHSYQNIDKNQLEFCKIKADEKQLVKLRLENQELKLQVQSLASQLKKLNAINRSKNQELNRKLINFTPAKVQPSKFDQCQIIEPNLSNPEYQTPEAYHKCKINQSGAGLNQSASTRFSRSLCTKQPINNEDRLYHLKSPKFQHQN